MLLHDESPAAVEAREKAFVLGTYGRTPFHPRSGKGARIKDANGREYWDLLGGIAVNALGHNHPRLMRVVKDQAASLLHVSNLYYHPAQGILAEKLVRASGLSRAFFCNSGTEANEAALKFARLANPSRSGVVALQESFHGRTFGSLSITGHEAYRKPFEPLLPNVKFVEPNDVDALTAAVSSDTSAIVLEPILGEAGIIPLSDTFLGAARRLADRFGAVLIFDEVQCGLGRTGTLFAFQQSGVVPDIVTMAKPLGGGLPLGAVITSAMFDSLVQPGHHGTTFGGNPLACRLGIAVLDEIERSSLLLRVEMTGAWFGLQLEALALRVPAIRAVRGMGMMWGIELDSPAKATAAALLEKGFVVGTARENVLRLLPPYIVPRKALSEFLAALESVLQSGKTAQISAVVLPPAVSSRQVEPGTAHVSGLAVASARPRKSKSTFATQESV